MTTKRDYYEVLGVSRTASVDEIRKSYRQLALKFHPDRNPDDSLAEQRFKEATEAYSVLCDEAKRGRYDQFGHAGVESSGFDGGSDIFSHFQDLFSEFFGGFGGEAGSARQGKGGSRRGADVRVQERLTLREALLGCKREVVLRIPAPCETCEGSGAAKGTSRRSCTMCAGAGQVSTSRGFVMFTQTCPKCRGQGSMIETPCAKCRGEGQVEKSKKVVVTFPAGIDGGQRLRVPGQGVPGVAGAPSGDLYVDIELEADPQFERDHLDLITRASISYAEATLGTKLHLPFLDGSSLEVEVPPGIQPGDVLTLKNKGVPRVDGRGRGSLHVVVQVQVPRKISTRARTLLAELEAELRNNEAALSSSKRANAV